MRKVAMPADRRSPDFATPLAASIFCQVALGVLLFFTFDAMAIQLFWFGSILAFWAGMAFIYYRRSEKPTKFDLVFAGWGYLFLFLVVSPMVAYLVLATLGP